MLAAPPTNDDAEDERAQSDVDQHRAVGLATGRDRAATGVLRQIAEPLARVCLEAREAVRAAIHASRDAILRADLVALRRRALEALAELIVAAALADLADRRIPEAAAHLALLAAGAGVGSGSRRALRDGYRRAGGLGSEFVGTLPFDVDDDFWNVARPSQPVGCFRLSV